MRNTLQRINVHRYHISKDLEETYRTYPEVLHVCMVSEGSAESELPSHAGDADIYDTL